MEDLPVEALLAPLPVTMRAIAEELRAIVFRAVPDAREAVRTGWRVINYRVPAGRRREPVFGWIMVEPVHVHLGFEHGILIDDPDHFLGGQELRRARYVTLTRLEDVDEARFAPFIREAVRIVSMSAGERLAMRYDREARAEAVASRD